MENHLFGFEKLEVWQLARKLTKDIYVLTSNYADTEKYGITSQIRRCAVSVVSNIAEGSTKTSFKEQAHFTSISYGSLMELLNQLILSSDLEYISQEMLQVLRDNIFQLSLKLNNYRNSQLAKIK